MHLVLTGDDDGIQETLLGRGVEGISQRDSGAQLLDLHNQTQFPHMSCHQRRIVPADVNTHTHTHSNTPLSVTLL